LGFGIFGAGVEDNSEFLGSDDREMREEKFVVV
jgi:hypothetical protein